MNDSAAIGRLKARARAFEALQDLAAGRHEPAAALVTELAIVSAPAREALAELAAGRWARSIDLLAELAAEDRAVAPPRAVGDGEVST